jgi:hypothetical protein
MLLDETKAQSVSRKNQTEQETGRTWKSRSRQNLDGEKKHSAQKRQKEELRQEPWSELARGCVRQSRCRNHQATAHLGGKPKSMSQGLNETHLRNRVQRQSQNVIGQQKHTKENGFGENIGRSTEASENANQ